MTAQPTGAAMGPSAWMRSTATRASAPRASGMVKGPDGRGQRAGGWWAQAARVATQTALALGLCGAFIPPNLLQPFQVPEQTLFAPCCRWKKRGTQGNHVEVGLRVRLISCQTSA